MLASTFVKSFWLAKLAEVVKLVLLPRLGPVLNPHALSFSYSGWKKSRTTLDGWNLFRSWDKPSTVYQLVQDFFHPHYHDLNDISGTFVAECGQAGQPDVAKSVCSSFIDLTYVFHVVLCRLSCCCCCCCWWWWCRCCCRFIRFLLTAAYVFVFEIYLSIYIYTYLCVCLLSTCCFYVIFIHYTQHYHQTRLVICSSVLLPWPFHPTKKKSRAGFSTPHQCC